MVHLLMVQGTHPQACAWMVDLALRLMHIRHPAAHRRPEHPSKLQLLAALMFEAIELPERLVHSELPTLAVDPYLLAARKLMPPVAAVYGATQAARSRACSVARG